MNEKGNIMGVAWIGFRPRPSNYILQCYQHHYPFIKTTYTTTATYFFHDEMFPKCFLGSLFCIKQVLW